MKNFFKREKVRTEYTEHMQLLIGRATKLRELNNIEGIKDLQKTIWRRYQSHLMLEPYLLPDHEAKFDIDISSLCSINEVSKCRIEKEQEKFIPLCDSVVTFPWHPQRLINNLGTIGKELCKGEFIPSSNHSVNYYWPIMLAKVTGGNHSIAQGIIRGEGCVKVDDWYDLSPLIRKYKYTGSSWVNIETGEVTPCYECEELGMAWEVGRVLLDTLEAVEY